MDNITAKQTEHGHYNDDALYRITTSSRDLIAGSSSDYDANGNLTNKTNATNPTDSTNYVYNLEDRLAEVRDSTGQNVCPNI
ncbi:MAG: hypothetical protein JW932_00225 [Deltaproteobacteria bacterium]|nr:hypothetical protein [Deltaproteobacteria bacterium]